MTTSIHIAAHCASTKEVHIFVSGEHSKTLQDGELHTVLAYDDRVIEVKEVLKGQGIPPASPPKFFRFALGQPVKIAMSGEDGVVIGRAEYDRLPDQYQIRYVNRAGCAAEQWWEDATLSTVE